MGYLLMVIGDGPIRFTTKSVKNAKLRQLRLNHGWTQMHTDKEVR
jgi:hypothetical protein